jgi:hypothetical protein
LSQTDSDIIKTIKDMEADTKNLKHELLKICWFMRGGVTYNEALEMGNTDRKIIADIVKDNLETTKKTGQPFF